MKRRPSAAAAGSSSPEFPPPQSPNPRNKKTRELPNLSDCNSCNRRINSTNPKNKVGLLTSEWRIVLLCKSCRKLVESSQFCSYCLARVSSAFYECKKCRRRIHKDCVSKFSFGLSGNSCDEFSVCFDCWIPNLLENECNGSRVVRSRISKKQVGKNGVESVLLASSSLCNLQERGKGLENVVNEANVVAEKKIVMAIEAKEKVFTKVMTAKKAVEFASGGLGIVAIDKVGDHGVSVVDEDAQLAMRLHREMNSSPRISRNLCLVNTQCVDVPKVNGLESQGANEPSCSGREMNVGGGDNGMEMGFLMGQERKECGSKFGRAQDGKCNGDPKVCVITYIRKRQASKVVKCKEQPNSPLKVYSRKPSHVKVAADQRPCQVVKVEAGQCTKTYCRRRLHCKSNLVNSGLNLENANLAPEMPLTCREESRALTNAS